MYISLGRLHPRAKVIPLFYFDVDINDLIWALQKFHKPSNKMLHVKLLSHKFDLCQSLDNIDNAK